MPNSYDRDIRQTLEQLSEHIDNIDKKLKQKNQDLNTVQIDTHSIVRLSERMTFIEEKIKDVRDNIDKIIIALNKFDEKTTLTYVTKSDFQPIKKLVYGAVGFILITVLSSFMLLVFKTNVILDSKTFNEAGTKPQIIQGK